MTTGATALILSGGPGYSDPWHPFERTSEALAGVLRGAGHRVSVSTSVAERLADLAGVDLLVVTAPLPDDPLPPEDLDAASRGLRAYLDRGGAILAVHVGVTTLLGLPEWGSIVGARWVPERSGHPPLAHAEVARLDDPRTGPAGRFSLFDERYSDLALEEGLSVVVQHEHDGRTHPLVWTRAEGRARIIADALGHGPESFDSAEHRDVVLQLVQWALAS
ncbi:ThuA domain-containing protein [Planctomonas deserti]|uniref:ThuA domain-containing protein n=1 Tax=Planctomonas deserti TaxID=2144185 RepID=UPI000D3934D0|nr:ThuA domain-containing protein [Planctomonas deserti]